MQERTPLALTPWMEPQLKEKWLVTTGTIIDFDSNAINGICLESPTDSSTGETSRHDG